MKKIRRDTVSRSIVLLFFVLTLPASVAAQDVAAWFAKPANAKVYGSIAVEVEALGASIRAASLSDSLLANRLEEAAKKTRFRQGHSLATLKADTEKALALSKALSSRGLLSTDRKKATLAVEQATLLLRAGVKEGELCAVLDAAAKKGGKREASASRAFAALSVAAAVEADYRLSDDQCLLLAVWLVASDLPEGKLNSILSSIASLMKQGSSATEALDVAMGKVSKGKSSEAKATEEEKTKADSSGNKKSEEKSSEKNDKEKSDNNNGKKD